jgi:hypothetical protein
MICNFIFLATNIMSAVNLTRDGFRQLEKELAYAYRSAFHGDHKKFRPKKNTFTRMVKDNWKLIAVTAVGTFVIFKFGEKFHIEPRSDYGMNF